jgi:hypothetical protein
MNLETLQREMATAIMQPLTANEDMRSLAPDGRSMRVIAESFIAPNSQLDSFERLEIYNRQYWFRVLSALIEDFPALRAVIGGGRFDAISVAYLTAHPSRSFTLRNLGSKLPEWLAANPALAGRRHRLAVDVARIEWAFVESFDNAECTPLTPDQVATLDGDSHIALQPHLQLMALDYPADDLVLSLHDRQKREASEAGHRHDEVQPAPVKLPKLRRKPIWLASHRVDLRVYYRRLEQEEFQTLSALRSGLPLGEALEAGFAASKVPTAKRPPKLGQWFGSWAELGWLCPPSLDSLIDK